jgi:hypothetical protein
LVCGYVLGTTSKAPDALSLNFAQNITANQVTIVPRGSFTFSSGGGAFDFVINLPTPFFYNPSVGNNLILDVQNYQGGGFHFFGISPPGMDALNALNDSVSSIAASSAAASVAEAANSSGLVTQFAYTPVPEPSAIILFALGLAAVLLHLRFKESRSKIREKLCQ